MEDTINALGGILLRAIPTFCLVVFLHFYLKYVFFKPMGKVLDARYQKTEGARLMAEKALARAAEKMAEYESAMRAARSEVYAAQEQLHKELMEKETAAVEEARKSADAMVKQAREQLARDVEEAKASLAGESEILAARIADRILRRSAA